MPLTGVLAAHLGWRDALLVLAAIHGTVTIPLHALAIRRPPRRTPAGPAPSPVVARQAAVRAAMRDRRFWILAAALIAHGAATGAIAVHLVGYLTSRGHPATFAAAVAGLLGVLSVAGRLVLTGARRVRHHRRAAHRPRHHRQSRRAPACRRASGVRRLPPPARRGHQRLPSRRDRDALRRERKS
ncbi:MFS transporter [Micromonospora chalcea]|uniref:MFS transporter n=1 Tax=Micromonospora chalcea TaxID=1874 RepID=UPI0038291299